MEVKNDPFGHQTEPTGDGKIAALISYFGIILWLISYFALHKDKKTDFGSYQLRQTLLFAIVSTVIYIFLSIFITIMVFATGIFAFAYLSYIVYILLLVVWIVGFIGAINGEKKPMPFIGERAQSLFSSI